MSEPQMLGELFGAKDGVSQHVYEGTGGAIRLDLKKFKEQPHAVVIKDVTDNVSYMWTKGMQDHTWAPLNGPGGALYIEDSFEYIKQSKHGLVLGEGLNAVGHLYVVAAFSGGVHATFGTYVGDGLFENKHLPEYTSGFVIRNLTRHDDLMVYSRGIPKTNEMMESRYNKLGDQYMYMVV